VRDRGGDEPGGELGVHPVHRGLVHLHASGEADRLVGREPRPRGLGILPRGQFGHEGGRLVDQEGDRLLAVGGALGFAGLDRLGLLVGAGTAAEDLGPEGVHLGQVPQQVAGGPLRARGDGCVCIHLPERRDEPVGLGVDECQMFHRMTVRPRPLRRLPSAG